MLSSASKLEWKLTIRLFEEGDVSCLGPCAAWFHWQVLSTLHTNQENLGPWLCKWEMAQMTWGAQQDVHHGGWDYWSCVTYSVICPHWFSDVKTDLLQSVCPVALTSRDVKLSGSIKNPVAYMSSETCPYFFLSLCSTKRSGVLM